MLMWRLEQLSAEIGNFLKLQADILCFSDWIKRSQAKFTSPDIQSEMLSIMALMILSQIASDISRKWFTLMVHGFQQNGFNMLHI